MTVLVTERLIAECSLCAYDHRRSDHTMIFKMHDAGFALLRERRLHSYVFGEPRGRPKGSLPPAGSRLKARSPSAASAPSGYCAR
jgi:hypothetical protein